MKILYHHRTASNDGQAVHIDELVGALRDAGHEVRIVGPGSQRNSGMGREVGWVQRLKEVLPRTLYELMELGYSLFAYRRLMAAVREFGPDVIYERYNLFLLAGLMLKRRTGLPLLLEVNSPLVRERSQFGGLSLKRVARWTEGVVWRGADFVLPVTRVLGAEIAAYGVPDERIVVIPNGINQSHFAGAPDPASARRTLGWPDALVLGFTGFIRDWHGVDRVVRWMASPNAPENARLLVVGDGPVRGALESLARELSLGDRIRFTGVIPREDVPRHVAAFDIALQPAVVPWASPLKLFEYLALEKAVVAPAVPNIKEVLVDGDNAVLFDPAAAHGFEDALTRLCSDQELRTRVGRAAGESIRRLGLTWRDNARRVVDLASRAGADKRASAV